MNVDEIAKKVYELVKDLSETDFIEVLEKVIEMKGIEDVWLRY